MEFIDSLTGFAVGGDALLRTVDGGESWTLQNHPTLSPLCDISFYNDTLGVVCGQRGVLVTEDGGLAWDFVEIEPRFVYRGVKMLSPQYIVLSGQTMPGGYGKPLVTVTTDGWQTTRSDSLIWLAPDGQELIGTIPDFEMLSDSECIAIVWFNNVGGVIVRSLDSCQTWQSVDTLDFGPISLDFPTPEIGYIAGYGYAANTINGGQTWAVLNGPRDHLMAVDFANSSTGWAAGEEGRIFRTDDGGNSWLLQRFGLQNIYELYFLDENTGFAVGEGGCLLKTITGGTSPALPPTSFIRILPADSGMNPQNAGNIIEFVWSRSDDPNGTGVQYLVAISAPDMIPPGSWSGIAQDTALMWPVFPTTNLDTVAIFWTVHAFSGGDTVEASNGTGVFFVALGQAANDAPQGIVSNYSLGSYPNPFNASTVISFTIPVTTPATLRVFSVEGREVYSENLGVIAAGAHQRILHAHHLSSGIYFARLEMANAVMNHKMILLRLHDSVLALR